MVGILRLPAALGVVTKCLTSRTSNAHKLLFVISLYYFYAVVGVPANNLYAAINSSGTCSPFVVGGAANNGNEIKNRPINPILFGHLNTTCRFFSRSPKFVGIDHLGEIIIGKTIKHSNQVVLLLGQYLTNEHY